MKRVNVCYCCFRLPQSVLLIHLNLIELLDHWRLRVIASANAFCQKKNPSLSGFPVFHNIRHIFLANRRAATSLRSYGKKRQLNNSEYYCLTINCNVNFDSFCIFRLFTVISENLDKRTKCIKLSGGMLSVFLNVQQEE